MCVTEADVFKTNTAACASCGCHKFRSSLELLGESGLVEDCPWRGLQTHRRPRLGGEGWGDSRYKRIIPISGFSLVLI